MRGLFVTFEGLDGSGKSSHLRRVAAALERAGTSYLVTHEPGGTELGEAIRDVFLDRKWGTIDGVVEALLVFASRRQHLLEVIDPALARGCHVLCDRFTDSTLVYQGYGRGVPLDTLAHLDRLATGERRPDRTLLFDLPAELARRRGQSHRRREAAGGLDRLDAESLAFYERLRQGYLDLAAADPARFRLVDSSAGVEATAAGVGEALSDLLGTAT